MSSGTVFGAYLYRVRIDRGFEKISDFIRELVMPFTANYYRDVEAGRKILSTDSAVELHRALGLSESDSVDYFWHYFHDLLPAEIHELLFGKRTRATEGKLRDINALREYDATIQRKALALARYEREFVVDDAVSKLFQENFDLLPVMTYLYMVERASAEEISRVCEQIGVSFDDRVAEFLTPISTRASRGGKVYYTRRAPVLRMPRNEAGLALKNRFLAFELEQSMKKPEASEFFPPGGTFRYSMMIALPSASLEQVQRRVSDLISELEVADKASEQLDNSTSLPYFFTLVISGRPEYDGRA